MTNKALPSDAGHISALGGKKISFTTNAENCTLMSPISGDNAVC